MLFKCKPAANLKKLNHEFITTVTFAFWISLGFSMHVQDRTTKKFIYLEVSLLCFGFNGPSLLDVGIDSLPDRSMCV